MVGTHAMLNKRTHLLDTNHCPSGPPRMDKTSSYIDFSLNSHLHVASSIKLNLFILN